MNNWRIRIGLAPLFCRLPSNSNLGSVFEPKWTGLREIWRRGVYSKAWYLLVLRKATNDIKREKPLNTSAANEIQNPAESDPAILVQL
jgi:hypothetical protein